MINKSIEFAIIGMACRFPGAENYNQYWDNLIQGKNCIVEIPKDRWDWQEYYGDPQTNANKTNIKWGGFIDDMDKFDPLFFNISPKEAAYIDPQHRLFLQTAWHSIEDAGYSVESMAGKKIGIYAGVSKNDYSELMREFRNEISPFISTGTVHSILANRLSFLFDFHGRSEAIDTACSSGLVALHNAMRDINNGEAEAALVGGVNALLSPTMFISHSKSGMLSIDGQCKTFDSEANGYVRGEGVGILFIKPLAKAIDAGDNIHAVIKSSAVNHGGRANFLTSPTVDAQTEVISAALERANIDPATISYVEAHGTGTPLGDPIEINALKKAFKSKEGKHQKALMKTASFCALSSVKTNIGHLESASGIAGIIKAILAMQHKEIPALQNFKKLNPYIDLEQSPFYVADKNIKWDALQYTNGEPIPRRVGVSSFGMGGVNAHIILEEAPAKTQNTFVFGKNVPQLILISSKKKDGLESQVENLLHYLSELDKNSDHSPRLEDIAYTLQIGRDQFVERLALIVNSRKELIRKLTNYVDGKKPIDACFKGSATIKKGEKLQLVKVRAEMELTFLSEKWIQGEKLDWTEYYAKSNSPSRVPLPAYAFMKKRCWYNQEAVSFSKMEDTKSVVVTKRNKGLKIFEAVFKKSLLSSDFYIQDHLVQGEKVLPGVAYLEFARAVCSQIVDDQAINTIQNIYWVSPLIVKDKEVSIDIKLKTDKYQQQKFSSFQIMQNNSLHSRGELGYSDLRASDLTPINISAIKQKCHAYIQKRDLYQLFILNGLDYGPSFQALQKCHYNDQAIFSELRIPQIIAGSFDDFVLHPSIMDGVFQTIVALSLLGSNRRNQQYVPFYLERVDIIKPIPMHCYAYAYAHSENNRTSDEIKFDAVICTDEGELLVKMSGLTKRAIDLKSSQKNQHIKAERIKTQDTENNKADIYYHSEWQDSPLQEKPNALDQLIIFSNDKNILQQNMAVSGVKGPVFLITSGADYQIISRNQIQIDTGNPDDYLKMVQYLKDKEINIKNILYLWNFDADLQASIDPVDNGVTAILRLTKAIISKRAYKSVRLLYFYPTTGIHITPYHALVGGFARTLVYENPNMLFYTIGVDKRNTDEIISLALREFTSKSSCKLQEICYSADNRLERKVVSFADQDPFIQDTTLLRENGVYLITGGGGGLGFIFAKHLSEKFHATVLLIGRSKLNPQIADKIATIQSYGGQCAYYSADISKSDQFQKVFSAIKNSYENIHGVIHAAGIIEDAYILLKKEDSFCRVINTKVKGLVNLDSATRDEKLDFFVMFSSIAALMPNQGQSDYAAANSFLDSYAALRNHLKDEKKRSGVSVAINWPLWALGGMRITPEEEAHLLHEFGMKPLEERLGIVIFEQVLKFAERYSHSQSLSQIVAIDGDKEKIAKCLGIDNQEKIRSGASSINETTKKGEVMKGIVRNNVETEVKRKFSDLFNIESENIDGEIKMAELGLDSNSMVLIIRHINTLYGIDLKPTAFFELDTIDQFIHYVFEHCNKGTTVIHPRHNTTLIDVDESNPSKMQFQRKFSTSEFYLKDHVVEGQYNMPGACYIEMARQAGDLVFGNRSIIKLTNNYWARQLSSPDEDFIAYINIFHKASSYEYEIISYSDDHEKVIHAIGSMTCREKGDSNTVDDRYFDLNAVRSRCSSVQFPDEVYKQIIAEGLHVGPTFKPMQEIFLNKSEALATLILPDSIKGTLDDYVLHPTMLTGVFQTALISNRFDDENQSLHFIPIGIDELEIFAPITDRCFIYSKSHTSNAYLKKFDLLVCRQDGMIAASLKGFAIRALKKANKVEIENQQYIKQSLVTESVSSSHLIEKTHHYIKSLLSGHIGLSIDEIDKDEPFEVYGINSVMIVELNKSFEDAFGALSKTLFFEYRNTEELTQYFIENHAERLQQITGTSSEITKIQQHNVVTIGKVFNDTKPANQKNEHNQPASFLATHHNASRVSAEKADSTRLLDATQAYIKQLVSTHVGLTVDEIDKDEAFEAYGINSMMIVELNKCFENAFGPLSKTLFFEYRNVYELTNYFIENHADKLFELLGVSNSVTPIYTVNNSSVNDTDKFEANNRSWPNVQGEKYSDSYQVQPNYVYDDIAIIGVNGRYPGANNINEFWEILKTGTDCVTEIPDSRFDFRQIFDVDPEQNKIYSKRGGFIDNFDKFDAAFFNISPREAELIDPQERLFLEVAWGAIEDAGYTRQTLLNSSDRQIGVFVGALWQPYQSIGTEETLKGNIIAPSGLLYSIANRVSYFMNFSGPSMAIDTACSSSLTALHLACQSLSSGDCKLAIAGGVNLSVHSSKYLFLSQNHFLSTDGLCRSFGNGGSGYVPGEGVGAILLKPLSEAIKDGDQIYALVKGSSINHGGKTNGYTVPCPKAQASIISQVHEKSRINPRTISYIEAHGTGTSLGDPIEITGLQKAFEVSTKDKQFCAIGSVKSNIGHLEAAAGIASITKVILQMKNKQLVPSIHSDTLNSNIDFEKTPFKVQHELSQWQQPNLNIDGVSQSFPRRAGISSFGAGGSNAHVLLEEFINNKTETLSSEAGKNVMILLSAKNEERLHAAAENLLNYLEQGHLTGSLDNLAYTLQMGREAMDERLGIVVNSVEELRNKLKAYLDNDKKIAHLYLGNVEKNKDALVAFGDDEDMARVIEAWIDKAKYNKLLDIWVKGFSINWNALYGTNKPQRISVPTYPFAKERYWIPNNFNQNIMANATHVSLLHPLIHENNSSLTQQRFNSIFTGEEFFLNDHIVGKHKILPAAAYIEMFRVAASLSNDKFEPFKLYNLTWLKPITIGSKSQNITIGLSMENDEFYLQASMETNGEYTVHAQGQCLYLDSKEVNNRLGLDVRMLIDEISQDLEKQVQSNQVYDLFHSKGLNLQKAFQGISWIKWNEDQALGQIILPSFLNMKEREVYSIHPSLLDSALQTALYVLESRHQKAGALYLPFSIEEVEIFSSLPDTLYSLVRPCDNKTMSDSHHPVRCFDVTLLDSNDNILVRIKNISFRETSLSMGNIQNLTPSEQLADIFYSSPIWTEVAIKENDLDDLHGTGIVIVSNNEGRLERFGTKLAQIKGKIPVFEVVLLNGHAQQRPGKFYINNIDGEDYHRLGAYLDKTKIDVSHIIYLWDSTQQGTAGGLPEQTQQAISALFLVDKLLLPTTKPIKQLFINICEQGTSQWVLEGGITGFLNSVRTEYPKTVNKVVSIEANEIGLLSWEDNILNELLYSDEEANAWIRYSGNGDHRLLWQLESLEKHSFHLDHSVIKEGGTYLISGGMGGIAKILASYLTQNFNANLILLGRSPLERNGEAYLQSLKFSASDAVYFQVDICDLDSLEHVIAQVKKRFGTINGVIHSAGVIEDNLLRNKSLESLQRVMQPKLQGTINLDQVVRLEPLDFFLVFSSLTSVLGNPGQCDYGAANGFMDAFIAHRQKLVRQQSRQGLSLAINWPFWNEGKMGQDTDILSTLDESFGLPLDRAEGIRCFEEIFHLGKNQIVVVKKEKGIPESVVIERNKALDSRAYKGQTALQVTTLDIVSILRMDTGYIVDELGKFNPGQVSAQSDFMALGFESVILTKLASKLNKKYSLKISPAIFFEHTNLEKLNAYLLDEHYPKIASYYESMLLSNAKGQENNTEVVKNSSGAEAQNRILSNELVKDTPKIKQTVTQQNKTEFKLGFDRSIKDSISQDQSDSVSGIAVIGMDCIFPGAPDLQSFWELLVNCESAVSEIPEDRWNWKDYYGDPNKETNKTNIKWGCFIDDLDKFDASFFHISPREASLMDPQQRILLQSVWKAIEHAGYAPMELSKTYKVGFFVGVSGNDYYELLMHCDVEAYSSTGGAHSIAANRVSYYFDFKGPSIAVDTACSSSLVALDMAVKSLEQGDCDVAITGGVNALISPNLYISFSKAGMLSPNGNISPLDKKANGYVRGEGVGILVLKRLDKAIEDHDEIHAVIKGTSVNHGGKVASLTVPNPKAQSELVLDACKKANVDISTLNYIELHGTGTPLGDPIEVNGLKSAFKKGQATQRGSYCGIASVKGNIGHLEAAAGVAGMIKTVLSLKKKVLPGQCHFEELNLHIQLEGTPFKVVKGTQNWQALTDNNGNALPRRAGVSSFGFGGANSHVVIEEYVDDRIDICASNVNKQIYDDKLYLIVLSAKTEERLKVLAGELVNYLNAALSGSVNLERMAYTLQVGRSAMEQRLGVLVKNHEELQQKLNAFVNGDKNIDGCYAGQVERSVDNPDALMNPDRAALVNSWFLNGKFDYLLDSWAKGGVVDWNNLYGDNKPQRVFLPTYPFAKERYWISNIKTRRLENNSDFSEHQDYETPTCRGQLPEQRDLSIEISPEYLRGISTNYFKKLAASILQMSIDMIDTTRTLEEYGMDSILVIQVTNVLHQYFPNINSTLLLEYRTINALVEYFIKNQRDSLIRLLGLESGGFEHSRIDTEPVLTELELESLNSQYLPLFDNGLGSDDKAFISIGEIASAVSNNKVNFKDALHMVRHGEMEL